MRIFAQMGRAGAMGRSQAMVPCRGAKAKAGAGAGKPKKPKPISAQALAHKNKDKIDTSPGSGPAYEWAKAIVEAPQRLRPEFSDEELAFQRDIEKRYRTNVRRIHNHESAQLQTKLSLMREAFDAIPLELRHAALQDEMMRMPLDRWIMENTPPVKDYDHDCMNS